MALSPLTAWNSANNYTSAKKWGTGLDTIHYSRDLGTGRNLDANPPNDAVPDALVSEDYGYQQGDYYGAMNETHMRELPDERIGWDRKPGQLRAETPGNYPDWSPDSMDNTEQQEYRSIPHMAQEEAFLTLQGPYQSATGGMLSKSSSYENQVEVPPVDYHIRNTSMTQGPDVAVMTNARAQAIGLPARSPVPSRQGAMRVQPYAKSFEMGGGQDTPRMLPAQRPNLRRPFYYRKANLPVQPQLQMNINSPNTTYAGISAASPATGATYDSSSNNDYGYTQGDYYG